MKKNNSRKGYKKTKVGWIPADWATECIGSLGRVITGCTPATSHPEYYSGPYPFVTPCDLGEHALVSTAATSLSEKGWCESRNLPAGSILFVCIGSTIGKVGMAAIELAINQQINAVIPNIQHHNRYVYYALRLRSSRIARLAGCQAVPIINKSSFSREIIPLPSLPEQEAIAEVLACWDKAIRGYERKIEKKRNIKKGLMQRLLTGKQRLPGFVGEWSDVRLKDLLSYERPDKYIVQDTDYSYHESTPVLTANKSFILGYTSETFGVCQNTPAIVFDDFTTNSKFADFPFKVKSSAIKLLRPSSQEVDLRFVFERMQLLHFSVGDHKRYYISEYQHCRVAVPEHREQKAIAAVLSSGDTEITVLEQKLAGLREQKRFLLNNMVTGTIRLPEFTNNKTGNVTSGDTE